MGGNAARPRRMRSAVRSAARKKGAGNAKINTSEPLVETISAGIRATTNNSAFQETGIVTGIYRNSVYNWDSSALTPPSRVVVVVVGEFARLTTRGTRFINAG